jgi:hypothetical protein
VSKAFKENVYICFEGIHMLKDTCRRLLTLSFTAKVIYDLAFSMENYSKYFKVQEISEFEYSWSSVL